MTDEEIELAAQVVAGSVLEQLATTAANENARLIIQRAAVINRYAFGLMPLGLDNDGILIALSDARARAVLFARRNEYALGNQTGMGMRTVQSRMLDFTKRLHQMFGDSNGDVYASLPVVSRETPRNAMIWDCEALGTYLELIWRATVGVERWPCDADDVRTL